MLAKSVHSLGLVLLLLSLLPQTVSADVCTNCMGTGKMVSGWRVKDCSRCNGTGIVSRGGVPTIKLPDMGYQTNKFDLKAEVEGTGATRWAVAWGDDISETDAVQGVVAAGVSIYSANPGLFMAWVDALIDRTIDSMVGSAKTEFPSPLNIYDVFC